MIQIWNSAEFSLVFTTCTELYYDVNLAIPASMIICTQTPLISEPPHLFVYMEGFKEGKDKM